MPDRVGIEPTSFGLDVQMAICFQLQPKHPIH